MYILADLYRNKDVFLYFLDFIKDVFLYFLDFIDNKYFIYIFYKYNCEKYCRIKSMT